MTASGAAPRTLLIGLPAEGAAKLIVELEALGHDVIENASVADLVPRLTSLKPLAILRWRRTTLRNLHATHIDHVIVGEWRMMWLCRIARPRGATLSLRET